MSIHAKLVGAFEAIILSLSAAVTIVMVAVLLDPAFVNGPFEKMGLFERTGQRGTVTIQQIAREIDWRIQLIDGNAVRCG